MRDVAFKPLKDDHMAPGCAQTEITAWASHLSGGGRGLGELRKTKTNGSLV